MSPLRPKGKLPCVCNMEKKYPKTEPDGFCGKFERASFSLIEEPESCDVCIYYREADSVCAVPETPAGE